MENPELSQILAQNGQFVRALARSLVRDPARAEDVVQETWLRYVARPPRGTGSVRHWLRTVLRNLVRGSARADARREEREVGAAHGEALASVADEYENAELLRGVVEAVLALEEPYRSTILARYWRGWSAVRVAEETRTPVATVRSREQRALELLRAKLERSWPAERGAWGLALGRLLATEPAEPVAVPSGTAPLAKLGVAVGVVLAGVLAWRALDAPGAEPEPVAAMAAATATEPASPPAVSSSSREPAREPATAAPSATSASPAVASVGATPPSEVRVRFVFSDGTPAAGVTCRLTLGGLIQFSGVVPGSAEVDDWEDQSATSGADGRVAFTFVKPFDHMVGMTAELPQHAKAGWDWMTELEAGQVLELGDAVLRRAGVITGRLVRPDGTPVLGEGWQVIVNSIGLTSPDGRGDVYASTRTDPTTGAFRLEGVQPGANQLDALGVLAGLVRGPAVKVDEGATVASDLVYDGPDLAQRIKVTASIQRFRIGKVAAESVRLVVPGHAPRAPDASDGSRSFTFDGLEPGSYTLEIDDPRCHFWRREGIVPGTHVSVELEGNAVVVLAVSDGATGLPVAPDRVRVRLRNTNSTPNVFDIDDVSGGRIGGMLAGASTIEVEAGGLAGSVEVEDLAVGETRTVQVVVASPRRVRGTARFTDGSPAAGLYAALLVPAREGDSNPSEIVHLGGLSSHPDSFRFEVQRSVVDSDGRFELVAKEDGDYVVRVSAPGGTQAFSARFTLNAAQGQEGGDAHTLELVVARPGALTGRIPVPAGSSPMALRACAQSLAISNANEFRVTVALEPDGSFAFPSLVSGPARVFLLLPEATRRTPRMSGRIGGGWHNGQPHFGRELGTVTIPEGETLVHEFPLEDFPGALELTVRVNGMPAPWLALTLQTGEGDGRLEVSTDAHGVYAGPLFAGSYSVEVQDTESGWTASEPGSIVITRAQPTILTLDFQRP